MQLKIKRVYDPVSKQDGKRILVERLWPRGIKKETLKLDSWMKEIAPTTILRQWFSHDPAKWNEFQRRYHAELDNNQNTVKMLLQEIGKGPATLLYSAKDAEMNSAQCLYNYLLKSDKL